MPKRPVDVESEHRLYNTTRDAEVEDNIAAVLAGRLFNEPLVLERFPV